MSQGVRRGWEELLKVFQQDLKGIIVAPEGMRWIRGCKGIQLVELASISAESVLKFGIFFCAGKSLQ